MGTTARLRTGWEPDTSSTDTLGLACLRAMADRAADWAMAAGGRVRREATGMILADALSPCLFLNVAAVPTVVDLDAARAYAGFFPPGRPFVLITPHPTADLCPAGLLPVGHPPLMVRPPGGAVPALPPGVTVDEVGDAAGLAEFDRVLAEGYPMPHSPAPPALLGGRARFWLARVDGEPAAVALSYTAHGVVDVEAVATLPAFRRRGVGAAVTLAATRADPALPAVLLSSDDGAGVYRGLGFLPVTRWTLWWRP
jgi:ribosomal protein S18 acetylase RimI-like enzyme